MSHYSCFTCQIERPVSCLWLPQQQCISLILITNKNWSPRKFEAAMFMVLRWVIEEKNFHLVSMLQLLIHLGLVSIKKWLSAHLSCRGICNFWLNEIPWELEKVFTNSQWYSCPFLWLFHLRPTFFLWVSFPPVEKKVRLKWKSVKNEKKKTSHDRPQCAKLFSRYSIWKSGIWARRTSPFLRFSASFSIKYDVTDAMLQDAEKRKCNISGVFCLICLKLYRLWELGKGISLYFKFRCYGNQNQNYFFVLKNKRSIV